MFSTKIFYIKEQLIQKIITKKNSWDCAISIPGISNFHLIQIQEHDIISCQTRGLSTDIIKFLNKILHADLECRKCVAVNYEGILYLGEITKIDALIKLL